MVASHHLGAYLNQLRKKNLQVSVWYLLKEVDRCPPHSRIRKATKDEGSVDLTMRENTQNLSKSHTQTSNKFLHVQIRQHLLVTEKKERLLRQIDGPVLHNGVYLRQVFRLPLGGSTQQQMQESTSFVAAIALGPKERFFILCQAAEGMTFKICWVKK